MTGLDVAARVEQLEALRTGLAEELARVWARQRLEGEATEQPAAR